MATSLVVTSVVSASITVLPALLGFAGRNIDRLRLPWFRHDSEGRRTVGWLDRAVHDRRDNLITNSSHWPPPATGVRAAPDASGRRKPC